MHLLRRALIGAGHRELAFFMNKSLDECINTLLKFSPTPLPPLQIDPDIKDPKVLNGTTWVNTPTEDENLEKSRRQSLRAWWIGRLVNRDYSITEKMVLFWHNHFVTQMDVVKDSRYSYTYAQLLHKHALGNFKTLIREGTTNPAMLVYLNGNTNTNKAPNENYGRELLELFTLGKTPDVHYTEDDVKAAARVLSGWRDVKSTATSEFVPELHDATDKQFSAYFNNYIIKGKRGKEGAKELDELIDLIFSKKETAQFVCRNLYRWFVNAHITPQTETGFIAQLAEVFVQSNFEIIPVLRALFSSEHFFDEAHHGCIVKSPVDFYVGALQQFRMAFPETYSDTNLCWIHIYYNIGGLSMAVGDPPSVAGWPAYYQAPKYHQWWINSYTLAFRAKVTDDLYSETGTNCNGPRIKFNFAQFALGLKKPEDANSLIEESITLLLAVPIGNKVKEDLKAILLAGQQNETSWVEAWSDYTHNKNKSVAENRLNNFYGYLMRLPEYQLM